MENLGNSSILKKSQFAYGRKETSCRRKRDKILKTSSCLRYKRKTWNVDSEKRKILRSAIYLRDTVFEKTRGR